MPVIYSILSKLRTKCLIALLILLLIVVIIVIISVTGKSETALVNNEQTSSQPDNNFSTIEQDAKILPKTPVQLELPKIKLRPPTLQPLPLPKWLQLELQVNRNEPQYTKKYNSTQEAREAYFALHGRTISETKCAEYETIHCRLDSENSEKLLELFRNPHREGQLIGVGIGGRDTGFGEFPHMGALGWMDRRHKLTFKCGSSLISRNFILTAAHCTWVSPRQFDLVDARPQIVRLGNKDIREMFSEFLDAKIRQIIVHPAYKSPSKYSDIALMKLSKDVVFDLYTLPACLWHNPTVEVGTEVIGTGWGYTDVATKKMSYELQAVNITIIDSDKCDKIVEVGRNRNFEGVRSHQICAGKLEGGVDTCQGDSGGPIQIKDPKVCKISYPLSTVIGVTSFGFGCARAGMPSIYTRVSSYIDWIEENVWKEELYL